MTFIKANFGAPIKTLDKLGGPKKLDKPLGGEVQNMTYDEAKNLKPGQKVNGRVVKTVNICEDSVSWTYEDDPSNVIHVALNLDRL